MVNALLVLAMVTLWWRGAGANPNSVANDILSRYPGQDDYITPTRAVWSTVGGRANLFCNLSSPIASDPALLVLWYKKGTHKPIYSFDMRNGPPTHWKNPESIGTRATFDPNQDLLVVQRVLVEDEGTYRCRVDFKINPTLEYITNLTVVVPPRRLSIFTDLNVEARTLVGPFNEGDDLRLICRASGGSPPPRVTWWEGDTLLDMTSEVSTLDQVSNTLFVPRLTRQDLDRTLTCKASNTNLTAPLVTTVSLDMSFPPLWVRLLTSRDPLSANDPYDVVCQTAGARPAARITWMLEDEILTTHEEKTSHEGNVTTSNLRWTPQVSDAGKTLQCRAESPDLHEPPLFDKWTLDIYYVPITKIRPGRSLNLSNIEEGDDVYFECSIEANPWVYKIVWLHEGHELHHNVSAGVIISNQSLVLQRVARTASGNYYCVASNLEGDGTSNAVTLKVKYTPVCRPGQLAYHGAARYEQVNIPCHLEAHPRPTSFTWTFNNSGESVDIPPSHIQSTGTYSTVSYTPNTELDYGTLLCWGTNAVGKQKHPCVFHVFPAGIPDPVHNCSVFNLSVELVNVRCVAGFDGGLEQTFILELYDPLTNKLVANTTNGLPTFSISGLPPGMTFMGVVYSTNGKGRGEMVNLQVYTIKDVAERRTAAVKPSPKGNLTTERVNVTPILAVVSGVVGGLTIVVIVICVVLRVHFGRRNRHDAHLPQGMSGCHRDPGDGVVDEVPPCPAKIINTSLKEVPPPPASPKDGDEKNPDVIPQSADSDSWHIEGVNTISSSALPTSYASLPRSAHMYSQPNYQQICPGTSDVNYAELMLCGPTTTTTNPAGTPVSHHRDTQGVVYTTLDHKHFPNPYPHSHAQFPHITSANNTPKHSLHQIPSSHSHLPQVPTHSAHPQGSPHMAQDVTWAHSSTLGRRHSLRRDVLHHDPEASVPLMPNQKESSV
ncbi:neural cell adhesion molecule 2-like isoform X1 [Palaemon carinicauda]|uniref:neural cell adhesion molecule 2-like isoform X1 n=1 Tax=Palaemon carinicauda TaxID=392227 RepID=UPI0035B5919E